MYNIYIMYGYIWAFTNTELPWFLHITVGRCFLFRPFGGPMQLQEVQNVARWTCCWWGFVGAIDAWLGNDANGEMWFPDIDMIWYVKDCFSVFDVAVAGLKATETLLERSTIRELIAVMILWYLTSLKSIWFIWFILRMVQKNLKGNNSRTILGSVNLAWFGRTMILKHNQLNEWHPTWSVTVALKITIPTRSRHELPAERSYDKKALDLLFLEAWKDADSPFIQFYQLGRFVCRLRFRTEPRVSRRCFQ